MHMRIHLVVYGFEVRSIRVCVNIAFSYRRYWHSGVNYRGNKVCLLLVCCLQLFLNSSDFRYSIIQFYSRRTFNWYWFWCLQECLCYLICTPKRFDFKLNIEFQYTLLNWDNSFIPCIKHVCLYTDQCIISQTNFEFIYAQQTISP